MVHTIKASTESMEPENLILSDSVQHSILRSYNSHDDDDQKDQEQE